MAKTKPLTSKDIGLSLSIALSPFLTPLILDSNRELHLLVSTILTLGLVYYLESITWTLSIMISLYLFKECTDPFFDPLDMIANLMGLFLGLFIGLSLINHTTSSIDQRGV